jgi:hypothetical protein
MTITPPPEGEIPEERPPIEPPGEPVPESPPIDDPGLRAPGTDEMPMRTPREDMPDVEVETQA